LLRLLFCFYPGDPWSLKDSKGLIFIYFGFVFFLAFCLFLFLSEPAFCWGIAHLFRNAGPLKSGLWPSCRDWAN
jgi:hypothetical protein